MFTFKKGGAVMKEGIRKEYKKQYDRLIKYVWED